MDRVPVGHVNDSENIEVSKFGGQGKFLRNAAGLWLDIENGIAFLHVEGCCPVVNGLPYGIFDAVGIFIIIERNANFGRILAVGLVFYCPLSAEQPLFVRLRFRSYFLERKSSCGKGACKAVHPISLV